MLMIVTRIYSIRVNICLDVLFWINKLSRVRFICRQLFTFTSVTNDPGQAYDSFHHWRNVDWRWRIGPLSNTNFGYITFRSHAFDFRTLGICSLSSIIIFNCLSRREAWWSNCWCKVAAKSLTTTLFLFFLLKEMNYENFNDWYT